MLTFVMPANATRLQCSRNRGMFSRATLHYALANTSKSRAPIPFFVRPHTYASQSGAYVAL